MTLTIVFANTMVLKKIDSLPLESKYFLANLFNDLAKVSKLRPQKEKAKEKK